MLKHSPENSMASALGGRTFGGRQQVPPLPPPPPLSIVKPQLRPGDVPIGETETGIPVGIDLFKLIEARLLIQAVSGAGKSWTLRRLLEQTAGRIQQIVIDPEGEFRSYAEETDLLRVDAALLDIATLEVAGARAREHRSSLVLDLSDMGPDDQMKAATAFLNAFVGSPREHWHPALVAIDELQILAPLGGYSENPAVRKASVAAVANLTGVGRKRGIAAVLATPRGARVSKSVTSPILNFMIGTNTLDLDIKRAAETIGWACDGRWIGCR